ncbi:MAG: hypothetical protein SGI97_05810 [candidate division Zixibacteria bacterium]|nr:hypothetical protein [candidate division Zixibacteria bacterium]
MDSGSFIPAGRTSLVKRGEVSLQVQTEYAARPSPRITTTVLKSGQVLHKVERSIDQPISTFEEQQEAETSLKKQHSAVISIIQNGSFLPTKTNVSSLSARAPKLSYIDRLTAITGVQKVFRLDVDGNFIGSGLHEKNFKKLFPQIFKNINEVIELFARRSGFLSERVHGVYEVERDLLYYISASTECFFVVVQQPSEPVNFEKAFRAAIEDGIDLLKRT